MASTAKTDSRDAKARYRQAVKLATAVFGNEALGLQWLRRRQIGLGKAIPLTLLDTQPGFEAVQTLLQRIEFRIIA